MVCYENTFIDAANMEAISSTSSSLLPIVLFRFVCRFVTELWVASPHQSLRIRSLEDPSIATAVVDIDHTQFLHSPPQVTQILENVLKRSRFGSRVNLDHLISIAMTHAQKLSLETPESHKAIFVYCPFVILHQCIIEQEGEDQCFMIPASETSMEMLQKVQLLECKDNCTICLEEMAEAVSMPCSHSFHEDCIETWLNTSHFCPLCRFEMPIQSE